MDPTTQFPIELSLRIATVTAAIVAPAGLVLAYLQARRRLPFPGVVDGLVLLPMVLPPSVIGFLLVLLLGRRGFLGMWLEEAFGVRLTFTPAAAVIASCVVALPIMVKTAEAALHNVPTELEQVAATMGLGPVAVFLRVTVPAAWRGLVGALVLTYARALGEFGATLMFAGNIPGRTNTMPLEIFAAYQAGDDQRASFYVLVLCVVSAGVVWLSTHYSRRRAEV